MVSKLIGDKAFYKRVLALMIPIMIHNGITNFVNMLDNIMVGRLGQVQMSGVAIANQLIMVFNLCIFGAVTGIGIFTAQFFGNRDYEGVRNTFRFKLLFCTAVSVAVICIFFFFGENLMSLYLKGEGSTADARSSLDEGIKYMRIMLIGLLPYTLAQCYCSTLREISESVPPMMAGTISVLVNLCLNYILIFGKFGFSPMGVKGAAWATVISRFLEFLFIAVWTYIKEEKYVFIKGVFKNFRIPLKLIRSIAVGGLPLVINETLFSTGNAILNQCYSTRGLSVVAANNISQTFFQVLAVAFIAVCSSNGIILGQILGSGKTEKIKETAAKLIAFAAFMGACVGIVYALCSGFIVRLYNVSDSVKYIARGLMIISAFAMPVDAFANSCYFTLRSGGKMLLTILFDSCFICGVTVPIALVLSRFTSIPIFALLAICNATNIIKCLLGTIYVKKGGWITNIAQKAS